MTINRRKFLKHSSIYTTMIGTGLSLKVFSYEESASVINRWGMLINVSALNEDIVNKMVKACKMEHGWGEEKNSNNLQKASWIKNVKVKDKLSGKIDNLPLMCQHCAEPPCVDVCPTNASMKRADGIVLVDKHRCIGCRYCMMACPYDARSFVHEDIYDQKEDTPRGKGTVESCNMCVNLIDKGDIPACAKVAEDTVIFGDLNDKDSLISKTLRMVQSTEIRADLKLNTGVRYSGI